MKLRPGVKHFLEHPEPGRNIVKAYYIVEALQRRRWLPVGDETGLRKFDTASERDVFMADLQRDLEASSGAGKERPR